MFDITKLDDSSCMPIESINEYNYIDLKNRFEKVLSLIQMNQLSFIGVANDLHFAFDEHYNITTESKYIEVIKNTKIVSLNHIYYKDSIDLAYNLVSKLVTSWNRLNYLEKYILHNFSFRGTSTKQTDEEITNKLMTYKNKYFQYKKSAYIKISIMLGLNEELLNLDGILLD